MAFGERAVATVTAAELTVAVGSTPTPFLTKHGITLVHDGTSSHDHLRYGAWLNHSAFALDIAIGSVPGPPEPYLLYAAFAGAAGDLTGSQPSGSATWRSLMVGTPTAAPDHYRTLQGDATLIFTAANGGRLGADFDHIVNINLQRAHTVPRIRFFDIPVSAQGTFRSTSSGIIQGGIYGPGHTEIAGVFEKSGIIGAFGARR